MNIIHLFIIHVRCSVKIGSFRRCQSKTHVKLRGKRSKDQKPNICEFMFCFWPSMLLLCRAPHVRLLIRALASAAQSAWAQVPLHLSASPAPFERECRSIWARAQAAIKSPRLSASTNKPIFPIFGEIFLPQNRPKWKFIMQMSYGDKKIFNIFFYLLLKNLTS